MTIEYSLFLNKHFFLPFWAVYALLPERSVNELTQVCGYFYNMWDPQLHPYVGVLLASSTMPSPLKVIVSFRQIFLPHIKKLIFCTKFMVCSIYSLINIYFLGHIDRCKAVAHATLLYLGQL